MEYALKLVITSQPYAYYIQHKKVREFSRGKKYLEQEVFKKDVNTEFKGNIKLFLNALCHGKNEIGCCISENKFYTSKYFTAGILIVPKGLAHHYVMESNRVPLFIYLADTSIEHLQSNSIPTNREFLIKYFTLSVVREQQTLLPGTMYFFYTPSHCIYSYYEIPYVDTTEPAPAPAPPPPIAHAFDDLVNELFTPPHLIKQEMPPPPPLMQEEELITAEQMDTTSVVKQENEEEKQQQDESPTEMQSSPSSSSSSITTTQDILMNLDTYFDDINSEGICKCDKYTMTDDNIDIYKQNIYLQNKIDKLQLHICALYNEYYKN